MTIDLENDFAPLQVVKRSLADFHRSAYRVYKTPAEFVTVEAATALEAFRESGVKDPIRIVREIQFMERMVEQTRFTDVEEVVVAGGKFVDVPFPQALPVAEPAAPSPASLAAAPVTDAVPPPSVGANLSPEDVAALLSESKPVA